jgi:hypothetical protein
MLSMVFPFHVIRFSHRPASAAGRRRTRHHYTAVCTPLWPRVPGKRPTIYANWLIYQDKKFFMRRSVNPAGVSGHLPTTYARLTLEIVAWSPCPVCTMERRRAMSTATGLPPRADPGSASRRKTSRASFRAWLAVIQQKLQQVSRRGRRALTSGAGDPGSSCAYMMLVASDIRPGAGGLEG